MKICDLCLHYNDIILIMLNGIVNLCTSGAKQTSSSKFLWGTVEDLSRKNVNIFVQAL